MSDIPEVPINQTQFVSDAPPVPNKPVEEALVKPVGKQFKPISLVLFLVVLVVIIGSLLGVLYFSQKKGTSVVVAPTPTALPAEPETSQIRSDIAPYIDQINALNPEEDDHPFPPIDFTVRIKDPSAR